MSNPGKKNVAHSVFQRLLNRARTNNEDFNLLLSRYGMERFLYRLSISPYKDRFILKGAGLLLAWGTENYRVTRDIDLLGLGNVNLKLLEEVFRSVCLLESPHNDGITYLIDSLKVEDIREGQEYKGIRITVVSLLNQARIPLQIDIGVGDTVTPAPELIEFPRLLDGPAIHLKAYPRYTWIAEKLETMVQKGLTNSRMKDFYDLWLASRLFEFEGIILSRAIRNTFERRQTALPEDKPFALTASFYDDPEKQLQWAAFNRKAKPAVPPDDLPTVVAKLSDFLIPALTMVGADGPKRMNWSPDNGWVPE